MASYSLKASDVAGDFVFNSLVFEQFVKTEPYNSGNNVLKNTTHAISHWPQKLSWSQLNQQINNFLLAWLKDYKLGENLDAAFLLARCLELKSSKNAQFQSLLTHLIARVTNQLEQYKFSYVQNFDLDTGLPNQHLLLNLLNLSLNNNQSLNNNKRLNNNQQSDLSKLSSPAESTHLGLILINLNINYGEVSQLNSASSSLMLAAIHTIQQHLNDDATLFHVGAIDLAILINPLKSPTQLNLIATKLLHAFETANEIPTVFVQPACSQSANYREGRDF